ncbi:MAG: DUF4097 family beta strand repeat-containing protein [Dyella sp.]
MKTLLLVSLLLALSTGQALADTPIRLDHAASADAKITIRNVKGSVDVIAWDRNQVQVTGSLGKGAKPLEITGSDNQLTIEVEAPGKSGWFNWSSDTAMGPTQLEVHVPRRAALEIEVVSAPLSIDGTDGGTIKVNSVSGKLRINARTPSLTVDSVSGSIEQAGKAQRANLQTVSGDILAPGLGSEAELQTVSGRIHVDGGPWSKLTLSTVSGDVQISGTPAAQGNLSIDSMSGDVQLQMPGTLAASIHASTFSGDLRSDFGTPSKGDHGPGSELNTTVGNGSARIHAETFSGDLRIRKQD